MPVLESTLFPGDRVIFPDESWELHAPTGGLLTEGSARLKWTIFLDNAASVSDIIDLGATFHSP